MSFEIRCRTARFDASRTFVMGIVNVTPDSFSDGGRHAGTEEACRRARELIEGGADILDVGGESTRPGATPVNSDEEWERIRPVLVLLRDATVPVSVDTYKASVAEKALETGAQIVNDVSGGRLDPRIYEVCARTGAVMVLGHLRGTPLHMQEQIAFSDVFEEVSDELEASISAARAAGVSAIIADPGIGFGKTVAQNLELIARAGEMEKRLGVPVLIGASRKGFLGSVTGLPVAERGAASVGAAVAAAWSGARFVRVHDVPATRQALAVSDAIARAGSHGSSREITRPATENRP